MMMAAMKGLFAYAVLFGLTLFVTGRQVLRAVTLCLMVVNNNNNNSNYNNYVGEIKTTTTTPPPPPMTESSSSLSSLSLLSLPRLDRHHHEAEEEARNNIGNVVVSSNSTITTTTSTSRRRRRRGKQQQQGRRQQQQRSQQKKSAVTTTTTKRKATRNKKKSQFDLTCTCEDEGCRACHRGMIQVHKMGVFLLRKVRLRYMPHIKVAEISANAITGKRFEQGFRHPTVPYSVDVNGTTKRFLSRDYRHVVMTRNLYDALISGYYYHKNGNECWRDWFGSYNAKYTQWLFDNSQENWESRIINGTSAEYFRDTRNWPPGRGRDLCTYLSQESITVGIQVYVEWAMHIFIRPLLEFAKRRVREEEGGDEEALLPGGNVVDDNNNNKKKTLFLCYENVTKDFETNLQRMSAWLRPFRNNTTPQIRLDPTVEALEKRSVKSHSTSKNPAAVTILKHLIQKADEQYYRGEIEQGNRWLNCGLEQEQQQGQHQQSQGMALK